MFSIDFNLEALWTPVDLSLGQAGYLISALGILGNALLSPLSSAFLNNYTGLTHRFTIGQQVHKDGFVHGRLKFIT